MQSIKDFCFRFSHFHPDKYPQTERIIFQNTVGSTICDMMQQKKTKKPKFSESDTVYDNDREEEEETDDEHVKRRLAVESISAAVLASGVLYVSNYILDVDPDTLIRDSKSFKSKAANIGK